MGSHSLADLRKLERPQLKNINKSELIDAIMSASDADVGANTRLEVQLSAIAKELSELKQSIISSERDVDRRLDQMQEKIDSQASVITQQQMFLENIDRKERETNIVMMGVPEENEALDGDTNDEAKVSKIMAVMGVETEVRSHRRLGRRDVNNDRRKRPILVIVANKSERDKVLEKTRKLKDRGAPFDTIYVKKDIHPGVRQEWKRLREAEATERDRPENQGCVIRFDTKERKLYRDRVVIDKWSHHSF